jgi:hypothetical protein
VLFPNIGTQSVISTPFWSFQKDGFIALLRCRGQMIYNDFDCNLFIEEIFSLLFLPRLFHCCALNTFGAASCLLLKISFILAPFSSLIYDGQFFCPSDFLEIICNNFDCNLFIEEISSLLFLPRLFHCCALNTFGAASCLLLKISFILAPFSSLIYYGQFFCPSDFLERR